MLYVFKPEDVIRIRILSLNTALLWQKEVTKVKFLAKEQNVSVISTDVNGISIS